MKVLLWLDDVRDPFGIPDWLLSHSPEFWYEKDEGTHIVVWVETFHQFINWIEKKGLPDEIGFDHDLGEDKSGYDAAKWLVDYCIDNDKDLPEWFVQSANPVGRDNINKLLQNYKEHRNGN